MAAAVDTVIAGATRFDGGDFKRRRRGRELAARTLDKSHAIPVVWERARSGDTNRFMTYFRYRRREVPESYESRVQKPA